MHLHQFAWYAALVSTTLCTTCANVTVPHKNLLSNCTTTALDDTALVKVSAAVALHMTEKPGEMLCVYLASPCDGVKKGKVQLDDGCPNVHAVRGAVRGAFSLTLTNS